MRILTRRREKEVISYIVDCEFAIYALDERVGHLEDALKNSVGLQRILVEALLRIREDPDVELGFDPEEMLVAVNDDLALMTEHFS